MNHRINEVEINKKNQSPESTVSKDVKNSNDTELVDEFNKEAEPIDKSEDDSFNKEPVCDIDDGHLNLEGKNEDGNSKEENALSKNEEESKSEVKRQNPKQTDLTSPNEINDSEEKQLSDDNQQDLNNQELEQNPLEEQELEDPVEKPEDDFPEEPSPLEEENPEVDSEDAKPVVDDKEKDIVDPKDSKDENEDGLDKSEEEKESLEEEKTDGDEDLDEELVEPSDGEKEAKDDADKVEKDDKNKDLKSKPEASITPKEDENNKVDKPKRNIFSIGPALVKNLRLTFKNIKDSFDKKAIEAGYITTKGYMRNFLRQGGLFVSVSAIKFVLGKIHKMPSVTLNEPFEPIKNYFSNKFNEKSKYEDLKFANENKNNIIDVTKFKDDKNYDKILKKYNENMAGLERYNAEANSALLNDEHDDSSDEYKNNH